jgi:hypothetical protein
VEYLGPISTTSRGEKIQYPSRVEEVDEKDKIKKCTSVRILIQADREIISYTNPIHPGILIPQTIIGLFEYQSQQKGMGHLCPMGIQNDWGNQMVDQNHKNQQILSYFDQSHIPISDNNGCFPNSMGSDISSNKSKHKNKSKKRNGEIIARRKESCDSLRKRQIILPNKLNKYQVELYRSVGAEIESENSEILSDSPKEMVKFHEKTNLEPKRDNSDLPSTSSLSPSNKDVQI